MFFPDCFVTRDCFFRTVLYWNLLYRTVLNRLDYLIAINYLIISKQTHNSPKYFIAYYSEFMKLLSRPTIYYRLAFNLIS